MLYIPIKYFEGATKLKPNPKGDLIDVYSREDVFIPKGEMRMVHLGFAMQLPKGKMARLFPRSSTFKTWGVIQVNSVGIIDNSYCGDNDEWMIPLMCMEARDYDYSVNKNQDSILSSQITGTWIRKGDKIAQFEIVDKMSKVTFGEKDTLGNKDRGGFGSTGTK